MYVQMQRIKGNSSDSSGLSSWGMMCMGTCVVETGFLCASTVPRPCPFAVCPCLVPWPVFGTMLDLPIAACGGRKRPSSCGPDLAPGWDPPARSGSAKGRFCQGTALPRDSSAKVPLSSLQPRSQAAREERTAMAGQDWLSPFPWAGDHGLGCLGGFQPHGEGGWRGHIQHGEWAGCSHPTAQPWGPARLCQRQGCCPSPAPPMWGCDGAKNWEQSQSPSLSEGRAQLC